MICVCALVCVLEERMLEIGVVVTLRGCVTRKTVERVQRLFHTANGWFWMWSLCAEVVLHARHGYCDRELSCDCIRAQCF